MKILLYEVYLSCAVGKGITPHAKCWIKQKTEVINNTLLSNSWKIWKSA